MNNFNNRDIVRFQRIKRYWNYKSDPYDLWDMKVFSKEWVGTVLFALGFFLAVAILYLIACWIF
jgi:hypothetical protein